MPDRTYTVPPHRSREMMDDDALNAAVREEEETFTEALAEIAAEEYLELGKCPWCDDYAGEWPGRHARRAHPDAWEAYQG